MPARSAGSCAKSPTRRSISSDGNHPPLGEGADGPGAPSPPDGHALLAADSGWVLDIDEEHLFRAVAPESFIQLQVRVGSFVIRGQRLATVWPADDEPPHESARSVFQLGDEPSPRHNLSYGINELVDIANRSMTAGSSDSTTAREAVLHLGVIMREVLLHDLPPAHRRDDEGRQLLRQQDLDFDDYCEASFGASATWAASGTSSWPSCCR